MIENPRANIYETENDTAFYDILFSFKDSPGEGNGYYVVYYLSDEPEWKLTDGG